MNSFRTEIAPEKSDWDILIEDDIVLLGSCFTDNIGANLTELRFSTLVNPFGTLFSPYVIKNLIERAVGERLFAEEDFFQNDGLWHSWELNNTVSSTDLNKSISRINKSLKALKQHLSTCKYLVLTVGTAWIYQLKESEKIVANCHKMDGKLFSKKILSAEEISALLTETKALVRKINSGVKIIATLSPVRHWKDGAIDNFRSKAALRVAIDSIDSVDVQYFPAYEIMMDDLRDYRFYKTDMLHPSAEAIDYIFSQFATTYFNEETHVTIDRIRQVNRDLKHIPVHENSVANQRFRKQLETKQQALFADFPILKTRYK